MVSSKKVSAQHTIASQVNLEGIGVHSGSPVTMTLRPAEADFGIQFIRTDLEEDISLIPAHYKAVSATELCTVLGNPANNFVATVEHLMAALVALGVDNLLVELDSSEVPVMDGSSAPFIEAIESVGLVAQSTRRKYIRIDSPIRVDMGSSFGELVPGDGCQFDVEIDFDDETIGRQRYVLDMNDTAFRDDISRARTFGFMKDVERLWAAGYAAGSSLDNSVVIGDEGVVNPTGLRYEDEFVRHKLLDAVGDLALLGAPFVGTFRSYKGGHKLNFHVVKALFENPDAWSWVEARVDEHAGARVSLSGEPLPVYEPIR